jgi:hypothetical protein
MSDGQRATGNGQRAAGDGQRATGNGQRATGSLEKRCFSHGVSKPRVGRRSKTHGGRCALRDHRQTAQLRSVQRSAFRHGDRRRDRGELGHGHGTRCWSFFARRSSLRGLTVVARSAPFAVSLRAAPSTGFVNPVRDTPLFKGARCPLPVARCPLPVARCPLLVARCPLLVARCPLPVARCPSPIARRSPPVAHRSSFVVRRSLPVARCSLPVALSSRLWRRRRRELARPHARHSLLPRRCSSRPDRASGLPAGLVAGRRRAHARLLLAALAARVLGDVREHLLDVRSTASIGGLVAVRANGGCAHGGTSS